MGHRISMDSMIDSDDIVKSSPSGIIVTDSKNIIITFNKKSEKILGIKAKQTLGQNISVLNIYSDIAILRAKGITCIISRKNGRNLLISKSLLNSNKNVAWIIYSIHDVSSVEAEELQSMHEMNCRLESLIENSHDGIILIDHEKIVRVNNSYLRISGLKKEDVEEKKIAELHMSSHV